MRPLHLASLPGFILIRTCSPFWFDFASPEYPQRLAPHCSIRTLPSFCSVSQTPSGVFAETAGFAGFWAGADAGAVATTGGGTGLAAGVVSCWTCGAGALAGAGVEVVASEGATFAVVVEGSGKAVAGAGVCAAGAGAGGAGGGGGGAIFASFGVRCFVVMS